MRSLRAGADVVDDQAFLEDAADAAWRGFSEAKGSWKTICIRRAEGTQRLAVEAVDALAVEGDLALLAVDEAEQRLAEGGLARAGLADDAEGLGAADRDVEVVDGDERHVDRLEEGALLQRVDDLDALALEHRLAGGAVERAGDALGLGGEEALGVGVARAGEELAGWARARPTRPCCIT